MATTVQTGQALSQAAAAAAPKITPPTPTPTNGAFTGLNPNSQGVTSQSKTTTSPAVITSAPAQADYASIQSDYQNNIQPNLGGTNPLPSIPNYNVSATPTGATGETKVSQNGFQYYITPQSQPLTANDLQSILSSGNLGSDVSNTGTNNTSQVQPTSVGGTTGGTTGSTTGSTGTLTPQQQASASTGINPTTETTNYQTGEQGITNDLTTAYNTFTSTISSIMSGSFPLSSAQQALVDATNQAFNQMTTQSNLKAAALSSETGGVSNKVNATAGELLNITSQQSAAIAKLETGFEDQNYKEVSDAYSAYKDLETQKSTALTNIHNSVMDTYNQAVTDAKDEAAATEKATMDAQTIADDKITEGIDQERENIEQDTYNAQYGSITNGSITTPQANGSSIIIAPADYKGDTTVVNGVPVVPKADAPIVTAANQASALLAKIQGEYTQIKSDVSPGSANPLMAQYTSDVQSLNGILSTLSTTDPSFAGELSGKTLSTTVGGLGNSNASTFSNIQSAINSGLSNKLPGYTPPNSGQLFTTPQSATSYYQSTGQMSAYNNLVEQADAYAKANGLGDQASDSLILNFLNYGTPTSQ